MGGAVWNPNQLMTVVNSTFISNYGPTFGGALANSYGITVQNCVFFNNSASTNGGAVASYSFVTSINSTYTSNNSTSGGAVYGRPVISQSSTFMFNGAYEGGAICANNANIINSTFSYNNVGHKGGAIFTDGNLRLMYGDKLMLTHDRKCECDNILLLVQPGSRGARWSGVGLRFLFCGEQYVHIKLWCELWWRHRRWTFDSAEQPIFQQLSKY